MKVAVINVDCGAGGSTGRIALEIVKEQATEQDAVLFAYGREGIQDTLVQTYKTSGRMSVYSHVLLTRVLDLHGSGSVIATRRLVNRLEEFKPDVLWLHNLHGYYLNIAILFTWIKKHPEMKVNWLLHDCWAFTGHCGFFTLVGCEKWKTGCCGCPQKGEYPASFVLDNSKYNYVKKKELFTGVKNLTIYTPSQWLADLVKESFLKAYPVIVRHNTINRNVFKPVPADEKTAYGIQDKFLILGVANCWNRRKGLQDFLRLRQMLDDSYAIMLIGLSEKQVKELPQGIIGLRRTESVEKLAQIYSSADIFFNPTYEDNYPTVNLEAEACGCPVITYRTGGCPETIARSDSCVIDVGDIEAAKKQILSASSRIPRIE